MDRVSFVVVFGAISVAMLHSSAAQTVYTIGDDICWDIPPNSSVGKTFLVGDVLVFNFETNRHDVARVTKAAKDACDDDDVIGNLITTGPANVTLTTTGDYYYICTIGSHCQAGQKLAIMVVSSSAPGRGPTAAPRPPPDSASSSLVSGFLQVLLSIGVALIL